MSIRKAKNCFGNKVYTPLRYTVTKINPVIFVVIASLFYRISLIKIMTRDKRVL